MRSEAKAIWTKRVERWTASGLSAKEFGAEAGINPRTLVYWKYRLSREAAGTWGTKRRRSEPASPTFVEVTDTGPERASSAEPLEVVVGSFVVRVRDNFAEVTLERLLAVLGRRR